MDFSVCMATYNGQKFIKKQIESILAQMGPLDELVIVDDASKDDTVCIIESYNDKRIFLYKNIKNEGVNFSFEKAIDLSTKPIVFMSDQDDIWTENRVSVLIDALLENNDRMLVTSNSIFIDSEDNSISFIQDRVYEKTSNRYLRNIIDIFIGKENYFGCTMVFKSKLKKIILPFPNFIESHDLWIAKIANIMKVNYHVDYNSLQRRIHGNNASVITRGVIPKLWSRVIFIVSILLIFKRLIQNKISTL